MNAKSLLFGIVTGVAIGSITTLLITPKSGKEMKQVVKNNYEKAQGFMQKTKKETVAVTDQVRDTIKISTDSIKSVSNDLKDSVHEWQSEIEPALNQLKKEIDELQKTLQSR